ncbi:ABC transporter substrate-binding protein [Changpingibacter yushuensis]|uniref:ABC transporter substrate-binding protein n=1 Tax=Changpingibacter yushuensis TaxID=2758440 RepID=UPI0015F3DF87|nr:ABC transporter substrate-binding protein [Changpingibacter yushuensis]
MSRMKWGVKVVAVAAACSLALSACGGGSDSSADGTAGSTSAAEAVDGGTITAAVAYETTNYHPSSTSSALALGANWHVVEGLWELNMTTYEPFKALSASDDPVEVSDTQYEVSLRDGAKFSDGTDVTADDVVASFERSMAEGNIYTPMLKFISSVEKKDDTTVTINLEYPFSLLKQRLSLVKIVPASATDDELTAKPIGTGPWQYDSITEQAINFVPNEYYNGDYPATADNMQWEILKDDTARTTAMQEGTVDVMESVPADAAALIESAGAVITAVQGFNLPFLMFNTKKAPFDDERVRQAFFYAIDTNKLIDNALSGQATAATSFLPEDHPNYNEASTVYTYDPEKAKELLAEAGVDGLSITLLTTDHTWITALSPQIKNDLEAVGISVEIQALASSSLYADYTDVDDPQFDVVLAPGDPSVFGNDPDLLMNWWYGDNSWTQKRTQWKDSEGYTELHEILDAAVQTSGDEQQELWNQAFDLISEQVPLYPLFHRQVVTAYYPDAIANYSPIGTTGLNFIGSSATSTD